jgi:hypothetical protein
MTDYEPVIGLEIHVQLSTRTKMFCGCELSFGEPPNTRTCPVCLGLPGTLPRANARAIHFGLMIGLALGCDLAPRSIFHRKNYFYPDLPKGYQISQYDEPLCKGGRLGDVRIHRVHLEEDAAKLVHAGASGRIHGSDASVVDFNRGGTPLAEIVTEPDVRSAAQAREWLTLLRTTLRSLGVSDVNMEEGSLRCDANISIRPVGSAQLGTKTELKNMNSFRFLERGVNAEIARQEALLRAGEPVVQETLHFDPATERITSLRSKEEAHDYRYFPEPDLVPVAISEEMLAAARDAMPELPAAREERLQGLGVSAPVATSKWSVSCSTSPPSRRIPSWRSISASIPRSRKRNEFMFFSSVFVPRVASPAGRIDTFASTRSEPSSMFTSETPVDFNVARRSRAQSPASDAERRSGSLTISTSGVPPRLKSTTLASAPWIRPLAPTWTSFAASSSRCTRWMRTSPSDPPLQIGMSYCEIW